MPSPLCFFAVALAALLSPDAWAQSSIGQVQGTGHRSAFTGQNVQNLQGIVTAVDARGFWIQDSTLASRDNDPRTSDAVYVFRNTSGSKAAVGDWVTVRGRVDEFRRGGDANNLSLTQINASGTLGGWTLHSANHALPSPFVIGGAGSLVPNAIAAQVGNVETAPGYSLQPALYAMDYYEALEGMRVAMPDGSLAVSRTAFFASSGNTETQLISPLQIGTGLMNARGGLTLTPSQFNGHRLTLDNAIVRNLPQVSVGAEFSRVVGVLDYSFNNYKLLATEAPQVQASTLRREVAPARGAGQFAIASYNVENLGGNATPARFAAIVDQIKNHLGSPEIISLQEVQDDNGSANDSVVSATVTLDKLVSEIKAQTGKDYAYALVNPLDDQDGGQPGGNIRQAFLYELGKARIGNRVGGATQAVSFSEGANGDVVFNFDIGRIDPGNSAFTNSRKPLVADFEVDGQQLVLISNHFNSKGGDAPLFGPDQPPERSSEVQRLQQAQAVASFVEGLLAINPSAHIVVMGDLNDFQFADSLGPLYEAGLVNLTHSLAEAERYTYNYQGNSQALDHMFVSSHLAGLALYDVVHINAEFVDQISDHDPTLLTLNLAPVPEPQAIVLMLAGLGLLALRRRRSF